MRKILVILFCVFTTLYVEAAFVRNLRQIISQPDGTTLTLFLSGDEYSRRMHDERDYTVVKSQDGYYYYAVKDEKGYLKPSMWRVGSVVPDKVGIQCGLTEPESLSVALSRSTLDTRSGLAPSIQYNMARGKMNNIVILVAFKDAKFKKPRSFFESQYNDSTGISLRGYFKDASYGLLDLSSGIFPKCEPNEYKTYIDDNSRSNYDGDNPGSLEEVLVRAIESVRVEIETTYSAEDLDLDRNGCVDCITFVLQGRAADGNLSYFWPNNDNLIRNVYIHNKKIDRRIVVLEEWSDSKVEDVRVNAHEMFHTFGLPEFYHRSGDRTPVGGWDIMAHGSGHMCAYSKWKYTNGAWIKDIPEIKTSGRYYLKALNSGPDSVCYKIASPVPGEYVTLEFRKKAGDYEKNLPGSGLVAYRIKQFLWGNMAGVGAGFEVYTYRKNGSTTEDGDLNSAYLSKESGRTELSATSNPRLFYTTIGSDAMEADVAHNFEITDISSAAGERIYFTVKFKNTRKDTIYVKENGTGDGSSWEKAVGSIADAFQKCGSPAGSEIWIAGGNYTQNTMLTFKERVNVYGGFAGTEKSVDEREMQDQNGNGKLEPWEFAHPTILKFGSSGGWNTSVQASGFETEWNGLTVDGLNKKIKIESGYIMNACVFKNSPNYGTFDFSSWGGTLKNSLLFNNKCGGAPLIDLEKGGWVEGCVLTKNWSFTYPIVQLAIGSMTNSLIINNEEIGFEPGRGTYGILFTSLVGAVKSANNSSGHLQNCTVANNKSDNSKGWMGSERKGKVQLFNTILYGNEPSNGITPDNVSEIRYCGIQDYDPSGYSTLQSEGNISLSGNNEGSETGKFYPRFTKPTLAAGCESSSSGPGNLDGWFNWDWTLKEGSACIDAGSNDWVAEENNKDLKGTLRIMHGQVDIGSYEFEQKLPATIDFTVLEKIYTGDTLIPEYETNPAGMNVELVYKNLEGLPVNAGEYDVTATLDDPLYECTLTEIFTIRKADQEISWEQDLEQLIASGGEMKLMASASSGLPVRYESSNKSVATVEGNTLILQQSGNCIITACQDGDANRNAAVGVSKSITVQSNGSDLKAISLIVADGAHNTLFKVLGTESLNNSRLLFYNGQGKVIYDRRNYANDYDMGHLAPGTYYYLLTWQSPDGTEYTKKGFVEVIK